MLDRIKKTVCKNVNRFLRYSHLKNGIFRRRRANETAPTGWFAFSFLEIGHVFGVFHVGFYIFFIIRPFFRSSLFDIGDCCFPSCHNSLFISLLPPPPPHRSSAFLYRYLFVMNFFTFFVSFSNLRTDYTPLLPFLFAVVGGRDLFLHLFFYLFNRSFT